MSKYRARPKTVGGISFHSTKEANRYQELKLLEKAGQIAGLELQPSYALVVNGSKVCTYIADFRYQERGQTVVEDVKGYKRGLAYRVFKLKAALMLACHGIEILET